MGPARVCDSTDSLTDDSSENLWNVLEGGEAGHPPFLRECSCVSAGLDRRPLITIDYTSAVSYAQIRMIIASRQ